MSEIIDFYNGKHLLHGKTLTGVQMFNYEHMDLCHDFIQWMFPTLEQSSHHLTAPILTDEDIEEFNTNPILRKKMLCSFSRFLGFLGLEQTVLLGKYWIMPAANYLERRDCWQTPYNHNYLRITRVLKCLMLCGLKREAKLFFKALQYEFAASDSNIPEESYLYWQNAVKPI